MAYKAPENEKQIRVAEIKKNNSEYIYVTLIDPGDGKEVSLDIRNYYTDKEDGSIKPAKGIRFKESFALDIIPALLSQFDETDVDNMVAKANKLRDEQFASDEGGEVGEDELEAAFNNA